MAIEMTSLVSGLQQSAALEKAFGAQETSAGQSLSTHLADTGKNFVDTLQSAEAMSIKGIKGEASAYEVASAVMEAEQAIRMAVSVRDKIVNAYLEISRMQI
ncbi:flagellar hook-basal body complex protein FliE [Salaquimonas pukyongi]|uniref:flagellar hook-basal body complex protein FliE n=1 Tax=Salaquimonas pukyongi TaxID=2712698 RepID=UPI00096B85C8|nr:flagellar hook-basal body complex protein FliE [Salaquimonas pukyongi]